MAQKQIVTNLEKKNYKVSYMKVDNKNEEKKNCNFGTRLFF